jgi:hypothetical protein
LYASAPKDHSCCPWSRTESGGQPKPVSLISTESRIGGVTASAARSLERCFPDSARISRDDTSGHPSPLRTAPSPRMATASLAEPARLPEDPEAPMSLITRVRPANVATPIPPTDIAAPVPAVDAKDPVALAGTSIQFPGRTGCPPRVAAVAASGVFRPQTRPCSHSSFQSQDS